MSDFNKMVHSELDKDLRKLLHEEPNWVPGILQIQQLREVKKANGHLQVLVDYIRTINGRDANQATRSKDVK